MREAPSWIQGQGRSDEARHAGEHPDRVLRQSKRGQQEQHDHDFHRQAPVVRVLHRVDRCRVRGSG